MQGILWKGAKYDERLRKGFQGRLVDFIALGNILLASFSPRLPLHILDLKKCIKLALVTLDR
jgi:hypothetical protein